MNSRATALAETVTPPPPATSGRFAAVDSVRAVGAFAVLTTHVAFWSGNYTRNGAVGPLLARLDVGVAIFFVLSGFLLGRPWIVRSVAGQRRPFVRPYLWKRFLRIAPLYVVVAIAALALIRQNDGLGVRDWIVTLLMANTFVDKIFPAGLTQMWSLAVEVTFYLALPALMWALVGRRLRPRRFLVGLGVMVLVTVFWLLAAVPHLETHVSGAPGQWLPAYLPWFAAGLLLALVQVLHQTGHTSPTVAGIVRLARQPGSCWALVAGLMLIVSTPIAGPTMLAAPTQGEALTKHVIYALIGFLVVLTAVFADGDAAYGRVLSHPVGRRLGWISYGIFCVHLPLLHFIMWATGWQLFRGHGIELWLLAVVLSTVVAEVCYRVIERPALALKNRPPRFLRVDAAESTTAATEPSSR